MARSRKDHTEDAMKQPLTVGLEPHIWRAVKQCVELAARDQEFAEVVPGSLRKIDAILSGWDKHREKPLNYEKGEPNLYIDSTVHGFNQLSKLLLKYAGRVPTGCAGAVMNAGVRNAVRPPVDQEDAA